MEEQEAAANVNPVSANTEAAVPAAEEQIPAQEISITVNSDVQSSEPAAEEAPAAVAEEAAPAAEEPAAEDSAEQQTERKERVHKPVTPEMLERTQKDLMKMFDFLGFDDAVVKPSEVNGEIVLAVESADAGRMIGRKGQTLESIQLLLNRMMQKDDLEFPHVVLSIDGYSTNHPVSRHPEGEEERRPRRDRNNDRRRDRSDRRHDRNDRRRDRGDRGDRRRDRNDEDFSGHDETLRQQALDAAKEVRHWGDPVTLPEMNAHDRRIIHITLENEPDLITESEGDGARKSIRISIKK